MDGTVDVDVALLMLPLLMVIVDMWSVAVAEVSMAVASSTPGVNAVNIVPPIVDKVDRLITVTDICGDGPPEMMLN